MKRFGLLLLFTLCFSLATWLGPRIEAMQRQSSETASVMTVLMGDSRRLFANHFFAKADAYFHNGHYPTIFDRTPEGQSHMTAHHDEEEDEHANEAKFFFMDPPRDWIERFGRHFQFTEHSHLEGNGLEREILPWLNVSAEMDPHLVTTYVTAAYWLRKRLNKPDQAEQFLRQGLRANPDSYEILLELGSVYEDNKHRLQQAGNIYELALQKWDKQKQAGDKPDELVHLEILGKLSHIAELQQDYPQLLHYLELLKNDSPNPDAIQKQIDEAREKWHPVSR